MLPLCVPALADSVYRCGEAYSTSAQCADGPATEVKPNAPPSTRTSNQDRTTTQEMREAQALETKRLNAQRQAAQTSAVQLVVPQQPAVDVRSPHPEHATTQRKGKHAGKPKSPYFTAKDPSAPPKKESKGKGLPSNR